VFISYSHDNPEHKRWVGELASRLVKSAIDTIIDQWETGFGDDLPKFMEQSIDRADRVLVICSDAYVQKADDGKGGAGYEAMIVTGELVKNLTMNKFIPVIRQPRGNTKKPKFLETKCHIDFSNDKEFENRLEELIREIHKAPKFPKPKLGKNPFAGEAVVESASPALKLDLSIATEIPNDAREAYFRALELARTDDKIGWRKFLLKASSVVGPRLLSWRKEVGDTPPRDEKELAQRALTGVTSVSPTIAIALAGVESQLEFFRNQIGLIDDFLHPANWQLSGYTTITHLPEMVAFTYQALVGSVAMQTIQADIAERLAWVEISDLTDTEKSSPLFRTTAVTGWPESLNHNCTIAWLFLRQLPKQWNWLNEIFGDNDNYNAGLCAYYALLNIIEFVDAIEQGMSLSKPQDVSLSVPASFTVMGHPISSKASRLLEQNRSTIEKIWESGKIDRSVKVKKWEEWEAVMSSWIHNVYNGFIWRWRPFHSRLIKSL